MVICTGFACAGEEHKEERDLISVLILRKD